MSKIKERLDRLSREERQYFVRHAPTSASEAGEMEWLYRLLTNFEFMEVKVSMLGPQPLIDDYDLNDETTLRVIQRALRQEAHVLFEHPELLWQQLYARLQWSNETTQRALEREAQLRSSGHGQIWFQSLSQYRESSELLYTFQSPGATIRKKVGEQTFLEMSEIKGCTVSADGRYLILASSDTSAHVWDLSTRQEIDASFGRSSALYDCALSPDQHFLVTTCEDCTVNVWDFPQGSVRRVLKEHTRPVTCCDFSPDGCFLVSGSEDGSLIIWTTTDWTMLARLSGHSYAVNDCAITPDARFIISAGSDGTLRTWKLETGAPISVLTGHKGSVHACAISPNGDTLASAGEDGTVRIWHMDWLAATWTEEKAFKHSRDEATTCAFSPDANRLLSGGKSSALYLWDISSGERLATLRGHTLPVTDCCYLADGTTVVSTSWLNTAKVWDISHVDSASTPDYHIGNINECRFSPDGSFLVTVSADSTMKTWNVPDLTLRSSTDPSPYEWLWSCAISSDGDLIATGGDREIRLWSSRSSLQRRGRLKGAPAMVHSCCITADNSHLLSTSMTSVQIWDINLETQIRPNLDHDDIVHDCQLFPDGRSLATGSNSGLSIWDLRDFRRIAQYKAHSISRCRVSPNGRFIVTAGSDSRLFIWPLATGGQVIELTGHTAPIEGCAISPDTSVIVSAGGRDRTVRLWRSSDGSQIGVIYLPGETQALDIHPSLPLVACGDMGGSVYLLKLVGVEYGALVVTARRLKRKLVIRCPHCWQTVTLERAQLGTRVQCACGTHLRINSFLLESVPGGLGDIGPIVEKAPVENAPAVKEQKKNWWSRLFRQ